MRLRFKIYAPLASRCSPHCDVLFGNHFQSPSFPFPTVSIRQSGSAPLRHNPINTWRWRRWAT